MSELFHQLGIDWKLLFSQGVNFIILLAVLTFFLFKPLLKIIEERRKKIELGLRVGEEAERRLGEIDKAKLESVAASEREALLIIKKSESDARANSQKIVLDANKKAEALLKDAFDIAEKKRQEVNLQIMEEARVLVKAAIIKTVRLSPEAVDEALVAEAVGELKKAKI
jgi:F-type H+-transporting ATPase subunit b